MEPQINPETQKKLNEPMVKTAGLSPDDEKFLNQVVALVEGGKINLLAPSSLINHSVYDTLPEDKQGKVDFDAVNLISTLRNAYNLWKAFKQPTFQIENLVHQVRVTKERLEEISGDVYVI